MAHDILTSMQQASNGTTEISSALQQIADMTKVAYDALNELKKRSEAMVA